MKKYQVFDNNKPADCYNYTIHSSWDRSIFDTFEEAEKYAQAWLGIYSSNPRDLKINTPYNYSGGDYLEIREIHVEDPADKDGVCLLTIIRP